MDANSLCFNNRNKRVMHDMVSSIGPREKRNQSKTSEMQLKERTKNMNYMSAVRLFRSGSNKLDLTNEIMMSNAIRLKNEFNSKRLKKGGKSGRTAYDTPSNASPEDQTKEDNHLNKTVKINANRRLNRANAPS